LFSDAFRANRLTRGVTDAEIESVTREWLRTARNRDGGRRQREATKRQQLSALVTVAKTRRSVVSRTPSVSDEDISAESNVDEDT
jgi:predicted aminopeptidase